MFEGSLCVCCMSTNDLIDLFEPCMVGGSVEIYGEMLAYALNVQFNQDENPYICMDCANELRQVHTFVQKTYKILAILDASKVPAHHFKNVKKEAKNLESESEDELPKPNVKKTKKLRGKKPKYAVTVKPSKKVVLPKVLNTDRVCTKCGESFPCAKTLKVHYNEHFPCFKCDECGRPFASRVRLNSHMRTHKAGPFACDVCGEIKETLNTLGSHKRMKHSASKLFPCEVCGVDCKGYTTRRRHMFKEHGIDTYNYPCEFCERKFLTSSLLREHIRVIHLKVCNHQCPVCERGFKVRNRLRFHMEHAHNIGEKSHQCEHCLKRFSRKTTLNFHMRKHTNEDTSQTGNGKASQSAVVK